MNRKPLEIKTDKKIRLFSFAELRFANPLYFQ